MLQFIPSPYNSIFLTHAFSVDFKTFQKGQGGKTSSYKNDHNFFPFLPLYNRTTALKRKCAPASIEILRKAQHCLVGELAVVAVLREQAVSERIAA